jgi:hypothetical protein
MTNWQPTFLAPDNTLMLPLATKRPLGEVAREGAVRLLGSAVPDKLLRGMEKLITDETEAARKRGARMAGMIFFPDFTRIPPVGFLEVHVIRQESEDPVTLGYLKEIYESSQERNLGEADVSQVQLPAGPALRFHQRWAQKPDWRGASVVREDVTYAIRPAQIDQGLMMYLTWQEPAFSDALIKTADAIAKTLQIKLPDES